MQKIKINELEQTSLLNNDDLFVINQNDKTMSISGEILKQSIVPDEVIEEKVEDTLRNADLSKMVSFSVSSIENALPAINSLSNKTKFVFYVDSNNGDDSNDGTKELPLKTIEGFLTKMPLITEECKIYLMAGEYEFNKDLLSAIRTSGKLTIIGKNKDTVLYQVDGLFTANSGGNPSSYFIVRNLVYNMSKSGTGANLNFTKTNINFYNVVFENVPDNDYAVWLPFSSTLNIVNCTKVNESKNFIRTTHGDAIVSKSYGNFSAGYATSVSHFDKGNNLFVASAALNEKYEITIDESSNNQFGVYAGEYSWNLIFNEMEEGEEIKTSLPLKTIAEDRIQEYVSTLTDEVQLLITSEGNLYLTQGSEPCMSIGVSKDKYEQLEQRIRLIEERMNI